MARKSVVTTKADNSNVNAASAPNGQEPGGTPPASVREIIGRTVFDTTPIWKMQIARTYDSSQVDYGFWDRLRHGLADGYSLGALFCKPLTQILASWVVGGELKLRLMKSSPIPPHLMAQPAATPEEVLSDPVAYTNDLLHRFWNHVRSMMMRVVEDLYALGDQYLVVNPDTSITVMSPETAEINYADDDPETIVSYVFTVKTKDRTIKQTYTKDERIVETTITSRSSTSRPTVERYPNLIGRIPVVHLSCDKSVNERYGRPVYYSLLALFARYDDLLSKALDGAELIGNPIPTFFGMKNINEVIDANEAQDQDTYTDKDGNVAVRTVMRFDRNPVVFVGEGGDFAFRGPDPMFPEAVRSMLKSLFYLILDHTRIPEFMWGGAIASSKASAEVQVPPFALYIEGRRLQLEGIAADDVLGVEARGGLLELVDVWLRTRALSDKKVVVGSVHIRWPDLTEMDETLRLNWVKLLAGLGMLTEETTVGQAGIVDDPHSEVTAAHEQLRARRLAREEDQAEVLRRIAAKEKAITSGQSSEEDEQQQ